MPTTPAIILADVALQFVLVGAVAAILLIALAFTLLSRSGRGSAPDGQPQSPRRASGGEAQKSTAPSSPAQPGYGAAPTPYAPPQSASAAPPSYEAPQSPPPPAYAAPATDYDAPASAPWEPAPAPGSPPVAAPAPQPGAEGYGAAAPPPSAPAPEPSPESTGARWPIPAATPADSASSDDAPASAGAFDDLVPLEQERSSGENAPAEQDAPALPRHVPITTEASTPAEGTATSDAPSAPPPAPGSEPFAPTAGSASSDIDFGYMEREVPWHEQEGAGEDAFALPAADEKRTETPAAEEVAGIEPATGGDEAEDERLRGITLGGVDRQQSDQAPASAPTTASLQFTSFYPREVPTQQWQTLLVYTHIADALDAVRRDALKFAEELGERPRVMQAAASQPVERGTSLTIVPSCAGVRFNPERLSLSWDEDWQRSSFRFQAADELAGSAAAGEIAVYVGPLILAILKFGLLVRDAAQTSENLSSTQQQTVGPSSVFASYSHDDTPVVLACRNAYRALGLTVNIDVDTLRSGDQWDPRLLQLINSSDVFQLFWSARAASSEAVQREWRYALAHTHGAGYIRPVYWEQPLIAPPPELSNVHFAYIDLPRE